MCTEMAKNNSTHRSITKLMPGFNEIRLDGRRPTAYRQLLVRPVSLSMWIRAREKKRHRQRVNGDESGVLLLIVEL